MSRLSRSAAALGAALFSLLSAPAPSHAQTPTEDAAWVSYSLALGFGGLGLPSVYAAGMSLLSENGGEERAIWTEGDLEERAIWTEEEAL